MSTEVFLKLDVCFNQLLPGTEGALNLLSLILFEFEPGRSFER